MEDIQKLILLEGLRNSVRYSGIPNQKTVIGVIMRDYPELRAKKSQILTLIGDIFDTIKKMPLKEQETRLLQLDPNALRVKPKMTEKTPKP